MHCWYTEYEDDFIVHMNSNPCSFQVLVIAAHCEDPLAYVLAIVISLLFVGQETLTQKEGELIYHKHTTAMLVLTKREWISALISSAALWFLCLQHCFFSSAFCSSLIFISTSVSLGAHLVSWLLWNISLSLSFFWVSFSNMIHNPEEFEKKSL